MTGSSAKRDNMDRNLVLGLTGLVLGALILFTAYGPQRRDEDPQPTTFNSGTHGAKALYLLAPELGYDAQRWDRPVEDLNDVEAARTTLVLAAPIPPVKGLKAAQQAIAAFLKRGGRVLATGQGGASLLPDGAAEPSSRLEKQLCYTQAEGTGELARAGKLAIDDFVHWSASGPQFRVEERCGDDAVVVRYPVGQGEAIWWSSSMPLSNAGMKDDGSLLLTLASLGPARAGDARRTVLFDEYLHRQRESVGDTLKGLPWWALGLQLAGVALLLVVSFGRRNGPTRAPLRVPRTSPLEFADSMGKLYQRANATEAPLDAARGQTLTFLADECGLSREVLRRPPAEIVDALQTRIGGNWVALGEHLEAAAQASVSAPTGKRALQLVQALEADRQALQVQVSAARLVAGR